MKQRAHGRQSASTADRRARAWKENTGPSSIHTTPDKLAHSPFASLLNTNTPHSFLCTSASSPITPLKVSVADGYRPSTTQDDLDDSRSGQETPRLTRPAHHILKFGRRALASSTETEIPIEDASKCFSLSWSCSASSLSISSSIAVDLSSLAPPPDNMTSGSTGHLMKSALPTPPSTPALNPTPYTPPTPSPRPQTSLARPSSTTALPRPPSLAPVTSPRSSHLWSTSSTSLRPSSSTFTALRPSSTIISSSHWEPLSYGVSGLGREYETLYEFRARKMAVASHFFAQLRLAVEQAPVGRLALEGERLEGADTLMPLVANEADGYFAWEAKWRAREGLSAKETVEW